MSDGIDERLRAVENKLDVLCDRVESAGADLKKIVEKHEDVLNGDNGLKIRVAIMEKTEEKRGNYLKVLTAAILGLFTDFIIGLFKK